MPAMSVLQTQV